MLLIAPKSVVFALTGSYVGKPYKAETQEGVLALVLLQHCALLVKVVGLV